MKLNESAAREVHAQNGLFASTSIPLLLVSSREFVQIMVRFSGQSPCRKVGPTAITMRVTPPPGLYFRARYLHNKKNVSRASVALEKSCGGLSANMPSAIGTFVTE